MKSDSGEEKDKTRSGLFIISDICITEASLNSDWRGELKSDSGEENEISL